MQGRLTVGLLELDGFLDQHDGDIVFDASSRFQALLTAALRKAHREGEIVLGSPGPSPQIAAELLNLGAFGLIRGAEDSTTFYKRLGHFVKIYVAGLR